MLALLNDAALLAQDPGKPTGPEFGKASPVGLIVVVILLVGTAVLVISMNRHLKRLPATFEPEHPEPDQQADEGTDPGAVTESADSAAGVSLSGDPEPNR